MPTINNIPTLLDIPFPPDLKRHIKLDYSLVKIWEWIGPKMFYNKILGYRGPFVKDYENNISKAVKLYEDVEDVKKYVLEKNNDLMEPKAIYQFFKCNKVNDTINIYKVEDVKSPNKSLLTSFNFPRQKTKNKLCLSDYINSEGDYIGMFTNTSGNLVNETAEELRDNDEYKNSFILQALGLATAEALAELLHYDMRVMWGFPDSEKINRADIFLSKYRGLRYSFGYPACPDLEDQTKLWELLKPDEIGIELTEGFMMDPEASVSAIVFHHPEAKYFAV